MKTLEGLQCSSKAKISPIKATLDATNETQKQPSRVGERGMDWEFGISRCKLLFIEWMNKVLL